MWRRLHLLKAIGADSAEIACRSAVGLGDKNKCLPGIRPSSKDTNPFYSSIKAKEISQDSLVKAPIYVSR